MRRKTTAIYLLGLCAAIWFVPGRTSGQLVDWAIQTQADDFAQGTALTVSDDSYLYSAGMFGDTLRFNSSGTPAIGSPKKVGSNGYISKYTSDGVCIWAKPVIGDTTVHIRDIRIGVDGNIVVAGHFTGNAAFGPALNGGELASSGKANGFLASYDSAGNFLWVKQLRGADVAVMSLAIDKQGNICIGGIAGNHTSGGSGTDLIFIEGGCSLTPLGTAKHDGFVMKFDANGDCLWAKAIGGVLNPDKNIGVMGVDTDGEGNLYLTGPFAGTIQYPFAGTMPDLVGKGDVDLFICKLNANGGAVWIRSAGSPQQDMANSIRVSLSGSVYVAGSYGGVINFDPGNTTGESEFTHTMMGLNAFMLRLDTSGAFKWVRGLPALGGAVQSRKITVDRNENIYTVGTYVGSADFNPDPAVTDSRQAFTGADMWTLKLDSAGNKVWVHVVRKQGNGAKGPVALVADGMNKVYVSGHFEATADMDPDGGGIELVTANPRETFLMKFTCSDSTSSEIDVRTCSEYELNGIVYNAPGTYIQRMLNAAGCDSVIHIRISPAEAEPVQILDDNGVLGASYSAREYVWMRNGTVIPGATDSAYTVSEDGDYQLAVVTQEGCTDTSSVHEIRGLSVDLCCDGQREVRIFPNPARSVLYIDAGQPAEVRISAADGRTVLEQKAGAATELVRIHMLPEGLYLIRVTDEAGRLIHTGRFLKQHGR